VLPTPAKIFRLGRPKDSATGENSALVPKRREANVLWKKEKISGKVSELKTSIS
jgi:hypothetical protein